MPKYIKELTLDISGKRNNQTITAKQGDNKSRFIRITLVDGETKVTLEQGENVDFRCLKPDKKSCKLPTTIEEGGTILVELDDNSLAVAGLVRADVEINNADGLALSSTTFYIQVEPSADNGNYIPSTSNQKMARSLDMDGHGIQNLPAPTENGDAVNKEYVDSLQSDMNVNDESNPAFIKNRTHWKEDIERDYTVIPNAEPDPTLGMIVYGSRIGLEIGKEYTLEAHLLDGTTQTLQAVATEFPEDEIGIAGIPCIILENICNIIDGIVFDLTTETITVGDNCYYSFDSSVTSVLEKGIIQNLPNVETVVHQISEEYIPKQSFAIKDSSVTTEKLADSSVTTEKVVDGSITSKKLEQPVLIQQISFSGGSPVDYISLPESVFNKYKKVKISGYVDLYFTDTESKADTMRVTTVTGNSILTAYFGDIFTVSRVYIDVVFDLVKSSILNNNYDEIYSFGRIQNNSVVDAFAYSDSTGKQISGWNSVSPKTPLKIYFGASNTMFTQRQIELAQINVIGLETV